MLRVLKVVAIIVLIGCSTSQTVAPKSNVSYVFNRAPLAPSPFAKLPIGSIAPKGWLRKQLQLSADGMVGNLPEVSHFCRRDSGWWTGKGEGWEELPYWLKGFGDLGYVLKDERIIKEARGWIEAIMKTQQEDGYFGAPKNKEYNDLWPNMVVLFAMQSYYEATGDERVISFMTKYFRYQSKIPRRKLFTGGPFGPWQHWRAGDNLESIYWLYNRTGEPWLLDLAKKVFERTADWTGGIPTWHGVNICMGIRQPGVYWQQSQDPRHLAAVEKNYRKVMDEYGQCAGGMFAADENCRESKTDPSQAAETCSMVEFMYSFESLLKITGNPMYADRIENIAFNSLPAAMTPDEKALHYLTAPNMVQCDAGASHNFQNQGQMVSFDAGEAYRCCQHNVAQGLPYYAEHLWLATKENGLAAVLYAPCEVKAKVGDGKEITILEETNYPFDENILFTISCDSPVSFPLQLRIPKWCDAAKISINGKDLEASTGSYITLRSRWDNGDKIRLQLPMKVKLSFWDKIGNSVSVNYGPLSFSLAIGENWKRCGGTDRWPVYEVFPTTSWNYGLIADPKSFKLVKKEITDQPFTPQNAPLELHVKGKRIPNWTVVNNTAGELQQSPVKSTEREEELTLIPMGCTRLRITSFPTIGNGPNANEWVKE